VPPAKKDATNGSRPAMWFSGMKFTLNTGVSAAIDVDHRLASVRSVNIAPLGVPVLPDV